MSDDPRLELRRPRDLSGLLADGFGLLFRRFWTFIAIAAAVVVPVELIVSGIGLERLFSDYDPTPPLALLLVPAAVGALVTQPLVTAMTVHALRDMAGGGEPRARNAIARGLESFTPLFFTVLMAAVCIAASALLIVVPIFLTVAWYFLPQAVVVENRRYVEALGASWQLVRGSWWRVFGIVLIANLIVGVAGAVISVPFVAGAEAADSAALQLASDIVVGVLTAPAVALIGTLLYYDLRARKAV